MKKQFKLFLSLTISCVFLSGCGETPIENIHEHVYENPTYVWSDDFSTCTATMVCVENNTHKEIETVNSVYTVISSPTCDSNGSGEYTATFVNPAFKTQTCEVTIETAPHEYGDISYIWSSDYSTCTAKRICKNNSSHIETETADSSYKVISPATMDSEGLGRYTVQFKNAAFEQQNHDIVLEKLYYGNYPRISLDGNTLTYGLYPQNNVNDETLLSSLNELSATESNGYYLYNDVYYAKLTAKPNDPQEKFDNGNSIVEGETYWFKCEPITWNILSKNNDEYYLLSSVLIDNHCYTSEYDRLLDGYYIPNNDFEYSDIRSWLNNEFFNSAFAFNNSHIQLVTVDTPRAPEPVDFSEQFHQSTQNKVYLPSYYDYLNTSYNFPDSTEPTIIRCCKTTDWTRANGAFSWSTEDDYKNCGSYLTRSPYTNHNSFVYEVDVNGGLYETRSLKANLGVRPAITIKLS